jgi:hypothetical protein
MTVPTEGKTNMGSGSAKWVIIIALGVVLGLLLWTVGNAILAEWQKSRRDREAAQFEAELRRRGDEQLKGIHAWSEIMLDAEVRKEDQYLQVPRSQVPARTDGTLRSRIESHPEYKRRLQEIGESAMRKELIYELSMKRQASLDAMRRDYGRPNERQWYLAVNNLLKELRAEGD